MDPRESLLPYLLSSAGGTTGSRTKDLAIKLVRGYHRDRWRLSPRRLGARVDSIPIDRPIFVLGTRGSGGTLIGRCLRRHSAVVSASGNSHQWTGADEMATIRNRQRALPVVLWGSKHRTDLDVSPFGTDQPHACDALLPYYRATAADATRDVAERFRRVLREHLAVYADDPRRARFLDKTHAYTVKIPLIASLLEESRPFFLLVVRNPYVVCPWLVERKRELFRSGVPPVERLRLVAEAWSNSYATALGDARAVRGVLVVRLEDFLAAPVPTVRHLADALQLDFESAMVPGPGQRLPRATLPGDRKWFPLYPSAAPAPLDPEWEEIITERCGSLAGQFGYTPLGARTPAALLERDSEASPLLEDVLARVLVSPDSA